MPRKAKTAFSSDLPSWVDSRQEQGLYFFTREEAIRDPCNSPKRPLRRPLQDWRRRTGSCASEAAFLSSSPWNTVPPGYCRLTWFIADLMAYLEQPYYVGLLSAASLHGAAHQQPQQFQVVTTAPQREVRKKGLAIRFFFKTNFKATPVTQIKVQTGHIICLFA